MPSIHTVCDCKISLQIYDITSHCSTHSVKLLFPVLFCFSISLLLQHHINKSHSHQHTCTLTSSLARTHTLTRTHLCLSRIPSHSLMHSFPLAHACHHFSLLSHYLVQCVVHSFQILLIRRFVVHNRQQTTEHTCTHVDRTCQSTEY